MAQDLHTDNEVRYVATLHIRDITYAVKGDKGDARKQ
jgi:hypothetical protein